jgi:ribosome recycling factor
MDISSIKADAEQRMKASIEDARKKFSHMRTGRASVNILDNITVDYYGTQSPLSQLGTVSAPESSLLTVQPWDSSLVGAIEKAIRASDLGLNPSNDGRLVRIPIPPLTEERRRQMTRVVHEMTEEHRTAIRNVRRDANDKLKALLKEKAISEDQERGALADVQKLTDSYIEKLNELAKKKEEEIMTV